MLHYNKPTYSTFSAWFLLMWAFYGYKVLSKSGMLKQVLTLTQQRNHVPKW